VKSAGKKHDDRRRKERKRKERNLHETVKTNDLSGLSMEERMAHYKKKYTGAEQQNVKSHQPKQKTEIIEDQKPQETVPVKNNVISKLIGLFRKK
jgi:uridine kinase